MNTLKTPLYTRRQLLASAGALGVLGSLASGNASGQAMLKFASPAPATDPAHQAIEHFGKLVQERTGSRVATRIFPGGQLGQPREIVQGLQSGAIEMAFFSSTHLVNFVPDMAVLDLPYLVSRREQVGPMLDGPFGQLLMSKLAGIGITGLGFSEASFRGLMLRKPIKSPAELAGQKIRVPNSPVYVAMFNAMGALPTPLAFGEMYSALQQGVVDGAENSVSAYMAYKFHEVAPHFYYSNHVLGAGIFVASTKALERMPAEQRAIVTATAAEAAQYHRKIEWAAGDELVAKGKSLGVGFSSIDVTPWVEATRSTYQSQGRIGRDVMEYALALK